MDQNTTTLLATLTGGFIALVGGVLANYITGKTTEKNEKLVFIRSKVEELFIIIEEMHRLDTIRVRNLNTLIKEKNRGIAHNKDSELYKEFVDVTKEQMVLLGKYKMILLLYLDDLQETLFDVIGEISANQHEINQMMYENDLSKMDAAKEEISTKLQASYSIMSIALASFSKKKGLSKL